MQVYWRERNTCDVLPWLKISIKFASDFLLG